MNAAVPVPSGRVTPPTGATVWAAVGAAADTGVCAAVCGCTGEAAVQTGAAGAAFVSSEPKRESISLSSGGGDAGFVSGAVAGRAPGAGELYDGAAPLSGAGGCAAGGALNAGSPVPVTGVKPSCIGGGALGSF